MRLPSSSTHKLIIIMLRFSNAQDIAILHRKTIAFRVFFIIIRKASFSQDFACLSITNAESNNRIFTDVSILVLRNAEQRHEKTTRSYIDFGRLRNRLGCRGTRLGEMYNKYPVIVPSWKCCCGTFSFFFCRQSLGPFRVAAANWLSSVNISPAEESCATFDNCVCVLYVLMC